MKIVSSILSVSVLALLFFGSCSKTEDPVDYTEIDKKIIQDYIIANGLDADSTSSGLYYVIEKPGNGKTPNQYSDVRIRYKGYLVSGEVFDEATSAITLNLSRVIAGWTEGLQYYKEGGSGTLLIPSRLGYGSRETGSIPANSVLLFDIQLDEVR
jgi:FKBP-type peptidyl-prolyl cis-trans isomerase FkpA